MFKIVTALFKILLASLLTGAVLSALNISANEVLLDVGLTPEKVMGLLQRGIEWALPNIVLGSIVVLPIWFVVFILRPPRG